MEIKELETQTEREMAAVILEQVLEIRKLRLALKAHEGLRIDKKELEKFRSVVGKDTQLKGISGGVVKVNGSPEEWKGIGLPSIDPMAVDPRSVL